MTTRMNLIGLTRDDLATFFAELNEPGFRSQQIMDWIYLKGARQFSKMTNLSQDLQGRLEERATISVMSPAEVHRSTDGSAKLLFLFAGGAPAESVLIPDGERTTLCISSQAGCPLACTFCQTGIMGAGRNLTRSEIVSQVMAGMTLAESRRVTNLVFMGMGEPMLNLDEVIPAVRTLTDSLGLGLGRRRLTISTAGVVPGILRLADADTGVGLAVSLNAARDELRNEIMPINRRYPISELLEAADYFEQRSSGRRPVTFEYVLLRNVNDTLADARALGRLLHGRRAKVNLIPHNPIDGEPYQSPNPTQVLRFQEHLEGWLETVTVRSNRGGDVGAACGQLGSKAT